MPDLQQLLDEIDRLELEIYPGPWVANDLGIGYEITTQQQIDEAAEVNGWQMPINSGIKDTFPRSDAEFIALARTVLPAMSKALRAVLAKCASMERGVGYRVSGQHDTWDSYHEGMSDMAGYIEETITDVFEEAADRQALDQARAEDDGTRITLDEYLEADND